MTGTSPLHETVRAHPGGAVLTLHQPASTELMNRFGFRALDAWKETVVRLLDTALPGALVFRQARNLTVVLPSDGTDFAGLPARLAGQLPVLCTVLSPVPVPVHSVLGLAPIGDDPTRALHDAWVLAEQPAPLQAAEAVGLAASCRLPCTTWDPYHAQLDAAIARNTPGARAPDLALSVHVPGRGLTLTPAGLAALSNYLTAASVALAAVPALLAPDLAGPV